MPEFAVDRETITRFFHRPIARSTFHDLVARGVIRPLKGIRGYYLLNDSLMRLGLRPVTELPGKAGPVASRFAEMGILDTRPTALREPQWAIEARQDPDHEWIAALLAQVHGPHLAALGSTKEKLAYAEGAVRAQTVLPGAAPT